MITLQDIQAAVGSVLQQNGYSVIASEVQEGFEKPACFIEVLPVSVTLENQFTEIVTNSVEITYHPAIETKEELIETAGKLKRLFLYTPLQVQDRFLSVNEITFDADKSTLIAYFELEYLQETETTEETLPKMENLQERVATQSYGTSSNTD